MTSEQDFKIEEVFESAVTIVKNLPSEGPIKPSDKLKLTLYGLYKQATCGKNTTSKPRFYQIVEQYKWDAWMKLGDMPREEAMAQYIQELKQIMDSIPEDQTDPEENKQFEQVLGKKFYDYWFKEWEQKLARQNRGLEGSHHDTSGGGGDGTTGASQNPQTSGLDVATTALGGNGGDTQSNSSDGSSVSLLDETQSPEADGYRTPTSLGHGPITLSGQLTDQFALAVLRLQHGLDQTENRLKRLEEQMSQSLASIRSLEHQTTPKQIVGGGCRETAGASNRRRKSVSGGCVGKLLDYMNQMKTVHWFYLSYPILVYMIIRAIERRRSSRSTSSSLR